MKPKIQFLQAFAALLATLCITYVGTTSALTQTEAAGLTPDKLVLQVTNEVLDAIKADKTIQNGDVGSLQKLVDDKVLPHVNFEKMTQLAVGRGWRQATPEQRQILQREFRTLLVRTYAGAVSQVRDHKVQLKPTRGQATDGDTLVRTMVVSPRGEPIQIDYRMEKTDAGWKIYDVNVLGVWLVDNYRNSFAQEINAGGVEGLIKFISERNRSLDSKKV